MPKKYDYNLGAPMPTLLYNTADAARIRELNPKGKTERKEKYELRIKAAVAAMHQYNKKQMGKQPGVTTGRVSSSKPNISNIPKHAQRVGRVKRATPSDKTVTEEQAGIPLTIEDVKQAYEQGHVPSHESIDSAVIEAFYNLRSAHRSIAHVVDKLFGIKIDELDYELEPKRLANSADIVCAISIRIRHELNTLAEQM